MRYIPRYKITDTTLNYITKIASAREVIEQARLIPKWEMSLRKEARLHSAHSSTSIEGNRLTLEQVKELSENKEVVATKKDKQEVENYLKALDLIPKWAKKKKIDITLFLDIHKIISQNTLKNNADCGVFRNKQVFIGKRILDGTQFKEVVEYLPPRPEVVPELTEEFIDWFNSDKTKSINPILIAGIAHYEVARIHPFIDGNGRTARLLASLVLYKSGFDHRRFFALDDYYDGDRGSYYSALKNVEKARGDLTHWLEYFAGGVWYSVSMVKETVERLGLGLKERGKDQIELTPTQIKILERIKISGKATNKGLRGFFHVSRQAIQKEVSKLVSLGLIELIGKGRNAHYKMKNRG